MSLRKDRLSWLFIGLFLAIIGATAYWVLLPQLQSQVTVRLGDGVFKTRILAAADASKMAGMDVEQLPPASAMLQAYRTDSFWAIDMKHRTTSFDIVWLDKNKKVVHIVKNASTGSRPDTVFGPKVEARYLIELRGGTVDQKAIHINSVATFDDKNIQGKKQ